MKKMVVLELHDGKHFDRFECETQPGGYLHPVLELGGRWFILFDSDGVYREVLSQPPRPFFSVPK